MYNIIGLSQLEEIVDDKVVCEYTALDIDNINLDNILINVDVTIVLPHYCEVVHIGIFG